ncbi:MAG: D-alanyl-D-alanine carboxypeptidase/D-alanyl-D-alanine-endopeptidase [Opitutaceae bacterium]|nr:D-alanyl-D-alanine carboxypeptidase/D-alanyl-D-alanine-endopeptidase [Opitutaceae bacterium]
MSPLTPLVRRGPLAVAFAVILSILGGVGHAGDAGGFRQIRADGVVVSLPRDWERGGPEVPVWLHLHGAPETVEAQFAALGVPGVLVNVTLPGLSKVYADRFSTAGSLAALLETVEKTLRAAAPGPAWRAGRLTISSFSAGFGGVRALLRDEAAFARIAALVMADSIYCGYAGDPAAKKVDEDLMAGFARFATEAAAGRKRLVISHSEQVPEGYASTTETADYLIARLGGARTERAEAWAGGLNLLSDFRQGGCEVLGFAGAAPEDHMRHLRAMAAIAERAMERPVRAAASVAELRAQLDGLVRHPRFSAALWGVKVVSLDTGATLFEHHAGRLMSPASNSKLYTGALALDRLGGDYRIATPIFATARPDAAGRLAGDLVISGRGDPSWRTRGTARKFEEIFAPFAAALESAGVKHVTGDLIADATWFPDLPHGSGWAADDLNDSYGAEISALTLEDNFAELRVTPGAAPGAPCRVEWLQPHTGLTIDNRLVTAARGTAARVDDRRLIGENAVHLFGQVPVGGAAMVVSVTVPRPAQWFAAALKDALGRRGIRVDGAARSRRWPDEPAVDGRSVRLGEVVSPPLRELVTGFMKPSQNLETDLIFAHVGRTVRAPGAPARQTAEEAGVRALGEFLSVRGLPADEVRFEEGSGLSRNNLTTANATVALLRLMATHREAGAFAASLPIAAVDGTIRRRMAGTPASGNVRAKTGTLRYANALSGYVTSAAGERLAFSLMLNRYVPTAGRRATDELDEIAVALARLAGRSAAPVAAAVPQGAPAPVKAAAAEARPNILFVISDDQSWRDTGIEGSRLVRTPAFDRVAREGARFTHAFSASPSCTPSRSAVLTGRHIWQIGEAGLLYGTLPPAHPPFTHALADAGYFVGFTGKGWGPGEWEAAGLKRHPLGKEFNARQQSPAPHAALDQRDYAANFEDFLRERPAGAPFFFWFGPTEPHRVFEQGAGLRAGKRLADVKVPPYWPDTPEVRSDLLDYAYEIDVLDAHLGRVLAKLEAAGELDNTLIVVTSDNGMPFPRAKTTLYDPGVRMPLAVRWPGRVPAGRVIDDFASHTDFAPTFLEAAGLKPSAGYAGRSLLPVLTSARGGRVEAARDAAFMGLERHTWCRPDGAGYPMRAIRTHDFLYIRNFAPDRWPTGGPEFVSSNKTFHGDVDGAPIKDFMEAPENQRRFPREFALSYGKRPAEELYDVRADPDQVNNLAADSAHAATRAKLAARLRAYQEQTDDPRLRGEDPWQGYAYRQTVGYGATYNRTLSQAERDAAGGRAAHKPQ